MKSVKESINYFKLKFGLSFGPKVLVTVLLLFGIFVISSMVLGAADPGSPPWAPDGSGGG